MQSDEADKAAIRFSEDPVDKTHRGSIRFSGDAADKAARRIRALEILKMLDLEDLAERHPQSLSGGQKQRLAIACALASGRKILLLDEPTSGLDYAHMQETAELLVRLRDMGTTILVVTHDSELIKACCGRLIEL